VATQLLYVLGFARFGLLYVLVTRITSPVPQWLALGAIVLFEVGIGLTGYYASFREPLAFILLALTASLSARRPTTWIALAAGGVLAAAVTVTWTAIKPVVRAHYGFESSTTQRLERVLSLIGPAMKDPATGIGAQVDRVVSRLWMIRFPALAMERVPAEVPHEDGRILKGAVANAVMPRVFFTEKGILPSESEKVRKYSGVYVAGRESGTSFAFGYVADSYVDFGRPMMFVPIFLFGCLLGIADRVIRRVLSDRDVVSAVRVVVLWSAAYSFEQSWVMMIGTTLGLFLVITALGLALDRALRSRHGGAVPVPVGPVRAERVSRPV
jgi:hypothetical protein